MQCGNGAVSCCPKGEGRAELSRRLDTLENAMGDLQERFSRLLENMEEEEDTEEEEDDLEVFPSKLKKTITGDVGENKYNWNWN